MTGWLSPPHAAARPPGPGASLPTALCVAALVLYAVAPPSGVAALSAVLRADVRGQLHTDMGTLVAASAGAPVGAPPPRGELQPGAPGLWLLLIRAAGLLSITDVYARGRLISLGAAALAAALVLVRLAGRTGGGQTRGEGGAAALVPPGLVGEILAAVLATATVVLSRAFFTVAASAGPVAAATAQALAALVLAERVSRCPADGRAGLGLALVAGLAAGGPPSVALLGWPVGLPLGLWALRRGERWPLLAPAVFVAGAGTSILVAVHAQPGVTLAGLGAQLALLPIARGLAQGLATSPAHALIGALRDLADQVGILAVLAAGVGVAAMLAARGRGDGDPARALVFTLWPLGAGLALRAAFGRTPDGAVGLIIASSALALPLAVGVLRLADRLGKARLPATAAVGIMIAVWPLLAR